MPRFLANFSSRVQDDSSSDEDYQPASGRDQDDIASNHGSVRSDSVFPREASLSRPSTPHSPSKRPPSAAEWYSNASRPPSPSKRSNSRQEVGDRFIPTTTAYDARSAYNRINEATATPGASSSSSRPRTVILTDSDAQTDQANQTYRSLLASELFPGSEADPFSTTHGVTPPHTPTKRPRIFDYSTPTASGSRPPSRARSTLDSPEHGAYSTSPLRHTSQRLLTSPQRPIRVVGKTPYKVLDAPDLADDFYLNLVDWSSTNILGVGLASCVYLWSADNSQVTKLLDLHDEDDLITSLGWAQQGSAIAIGTRKGTVQIWDAIKCKKIRTLTGHTHRIGSLSWSGHTLASGSKDRTIRLWDLRAKETTHRELQGHKQEVCGLKFSGIQPHLLASGGNDNKLFVWDERKSVGGMAGESTASTGQPHVPAALHRFHEHTAAVKAIAWSPHATGILGSGGGTQDKKLRFWNTGTGMKISELDTGSQVCNLTWSLNSNEVVSTHGFSSTTAQNQICIWRYPSLDQTATFHGHTHRVLYLAMSPDGRTIVTGAGDETLRFWAAFPEPKDVKKRSQVDDVVGRIR